MYSCSDWRREKLAQWENRIEGDKTVTMVSIDVAKLDCTDCPAVSLLNVARIREVETMRLKALDELEVEPRLILLCESPPISRFVYDPVSCYESSGLRANLREELVPGSDDKALFKFMNSRGIWVVDAALCPLHKLDKKSQRRDAATKCLQRHTSLYLQDLSNVPLVAIFPTGCRILKRQLPSIAARIKARFDFSRLDGLRELVDQWASSMQQETQL